MSPTGDGARLAGQRLGGRPAAVLPCEAPCPGAAAALLAGLLARGAGERLQQGESRMAGMGELGGMSGCQGGKLQSRSRHSQQAQGSGHKAAWISPPPHVGGALGAGGGCRAAQVLVEGAGGALDGVDGLAVGTVGAGGAGLAGALLGLVLELALGALPAEWLLHVGKEAGGAGLGVDRAGGAGKAGRAGLRGGRRQQGAAVSVAEVGQGGSRMPAAGNGGIQSSKWRNQHAAAPQPQPPAALTLHAPWPGLSW